MPDTTIDSVQNYNALLMGDVNGDWTSMVMCPQASIVPNDRNAIRVSVRDAKGPRGSTVIVPLDISNLRGRGVGSFQFDIEYDPAVIEPAAIAVDLAGTLSEGFAMAANSPAPGLLKVVVYGTFPVTADGVFANLNFIATGPAGTSSPLTIRRFRIDNGTVPIFTADGSVTVLRSIPSTGH